MWYKKSYIGDNTNWRNRPNSYYAYFDTNEYNSNPINIYAYIGNRIIFNYSPNMANAFTGMPQYSYTYIDKDRSFNLPTVSGSYNGYTFEGWYTNSSYTGEGMTDTYKPTENITLYAKFVQQTPESTEYYWYVGTTGTKPSSLPTNDSELATGTNEGWRKFTQTSGIVYNASENHITFNSSAYYWLIIPNNINIKVEANDGNNYLLSFESDGDYAPDSNTIQGYTIYSSKDQGNEFSGILKY